MASNTSIGRLARRRNYPVEPWPSMQEIFSGFFRSFPALLAPLVIIGGIYSGMFSPTERRL